MARFILDVASSNTLGVMTKAEQKAICEAVCDTLSIKGLTSGIITVIPIDNTNDNQFYNEFENGETNELSVTQIDNFKKVCNQ